MGYIDVAEVFLDQHIFSDLVSAEDLVLPALL